MSGQPGPRGRGAPASPTAQRLLATVLTLLAFAIVVLGFGLIFNLFGQYVIGLVVGAIFCALMVAGFVREQHKRS